MTAEIRVYQRDGKTAYVVYPGSLPGTAFEYLTAAQIHCIVEGYEVENEIHLRS